MCARAGAMEHAMISDLIKQRLLTYALSASVLALPIVFVVGYRVGSNHCGLKNSAEAAQVVAMQAQTDLSTVQAQAAQSQSAGNALANTQQTIQTRTQYLTKEVIRYVPSNDTACRTELERVRHTWNTANAGVEPASTATTERDAAVR